MSVLEFVLALVCVVMGCITVWIYMLSNQKRRRQQEPDSGIQYSLGDLSRMAESLKDRIDTLESILDSEVPDWREQNDNSTG